MARYFATSSLFCLLVTTSCVAISIIDKEIQIVRSPGPFIFLDRSTTTDIFLPVLPGHTWSTDLTSIFTPQSWLKSMRSDSQSVIAWSGSLEVKVTEEDIRKGVFFYVRPDSEDVRSPNIHLVQALQPVLKDELPSVVSVFPDEYLDVTVAVQELEHNPYSYTWDIEQVPLALQKTSNCRVKATPELHTAKLTVTVATTIGRVTSSTIIHILPPRWVIALIVIGVFLFLAGLVIGALFVLQHLGYVNLRRSGTKRDTSYKRVDTKELQLEDDVTLPVEN
jgi:hypothetical protein